MAKIIDSTSKFLEASKQFKSALNSLLERESAADRRYERIRGNLKIVLNEYCDHPASFALVDKLNALMREMEEIAQENLAAYNSERAKSNIVYMASQAYRSNYTSYLAGRWSSPKEISPIVKATMHNAAADSSMSLYEALQAVISHLKAAGPRAKSSKVNLDDITLSALALYCDGAKTDAKKFLDFADDHLENAPITAFNRGKFIILGAETPQEMKEGLETWKMIPEISRDPHPAELVWHDDNHKSLIQANACLRKKIQDNGLGDELKVIDGILKLKADKANGMFEEQLRRHMRRKSSMQSVVTATVTVSAASVILLSAVFAFGHDVGNIFQHIKTLMSAHSDLSTHVMSVLEIPESPIQLAAAIADIGGGGVLNPVKFMSGIGGGGVL